MDFELTSELRDEARAAWHRYVDLLAPFRPELHRYCRRLTGDLWDAEDLVQDTVLRGFAVLGAVHQPIANPRGYLVRIATNLWLDTVRRRGAERSALEAGASPGAAAPPPASVAAEAREAGARLLQRLSPQERAALVLKDVFDMSLDEIAEMLRTTIGSVKAALHRGRERLRPEQDPPASRRPLPAPALVERFVERLNASDLPALLELMLDAASIEAIGSLLEVGRRQFEREGSWLWQSVHVHPDLPEQLRPKKWENEPATLFGERVMLSFSTDGGARLLRSVTRFEEEEGRISRIRAYYLCPDTLREVGEALSLSVGPALYRLPDFMTARRGAAS
jgi:RNA polymerase sigma-70 factor (ECF subfamily)